MGVLVKTPAESPPLVSLSEVVDCNYPRRLVPRAKTISTLTLPWLTSTHFCTQRYVSSWAFKRKILNILGRRNLQVHRLHHSDYNDSNGNLLEPLSSPACLKFTRGLRAVRT